MERFLYSRYLPDLIALAALVLLQAAGAWLLRRGLPQRFHRPIRLVFAASAGVAVLGFLLRFARVTRHLPLWASGWGRGLAITWSFLSVLLIGAYLLARRLPSPRADHHPARRAFLRLAQALVFTAPVAATGYGMFIERFRIRLREADLAILDLHPDLEGLRLVQLTDIHLSPFLDERDLVRAVGLANETRAHLALVTGDLITSATDPLDACIAQLAGLRADAGVFGCLGNHEVYAEAEDYTQRQAALRGLRFLRGEATLLRFGEGLLNIAGVDTSVRASAPICPEPNAWWSRGL